VIFASNGGSSINTVTVLLNAPPVVTAGSSQTVAFPSCASLNGRVTDDGLPYGILTSSWSEVSGPGTVTFGNVNVADTTACFSTNGTYVLCLTASDRRRLKEQTPLLWLRKSRHKSPRRRQQRTSWHRWMAGRWWLDTGRYVSLLECTIRMAIR